MKKIGIVTIIDYHNFGNRLQNYAVSYLLNKKLHCKAVTLEGYRQYPAKGRTLGWMKEQIVLQLCRFTVFSQKHLSSELNRWYSFSEWSRRYIPRRRYYTCKELPIKLNRKYDLFVTGSDQVWNYRIKNNRLKDCLLSFADIGKKNAISASFGVDVLPAEWKAYYRSKLLEFSNISVREMAGAGIVKELIGKDVPVLIDPVLALSRQEWICVEKAPRVDITKPYVLKYYLGEDDSEIDNWAWNHGYLVYELMNKNRKELYSAGPGEFISLIRNAELVCTDSFHCIAFSILFSKPFIAYERKGEEDYMSSRIETLLAKFGLERRWSRLLMPKDYLCCDFSYAKERLRVEQKLLIDYISMIVQ